MTLLESIIFTSNWQCPHCQAWSSLNEGQYKKTLIPLDGNTEKLSFLTVHVIICKNLKCQKATITADLNGIVQHGTVMKPPTSGRIRRFSLVPDSKAKPQPPYIPQKIVADYQEACLIAGLSPKASATLSRRCLQGMIRDFFSVSKRTLADEINAIRDQIPPDVWEAIDSVRKIGNIGAHMEKDSNVIVDVDEDEARLLLELIEQLFDDWYVIRHKRRERVAAIKNTAAEKDGQKKAVPP